MRRRHNLSGVLLATLAAAALIAPGCGSVGSNEEVKLGVPYFEQPLGSFWCGPASVQMWAHYDGNTWVTQQAIASYMGGAACGASEYAIADAVNQYTDTYDAYWDFEGSNLLDEFMARQITSIDSAVPVIAIVNSGFHAGIVNGGKWRGPDNGVYEWEYVFFHDPQIGPNVYYDADDWIAYNCGSGTPCSQVISYSATIGWESNLYSYGGSVSTSETCLRRRCD